ncbi:hypothetical protein A3759_14985 [Thalassolituus sp. HI0120]|nr:hypothetical protein A3759_14985 [Thalassolituus sp. HI0120]
MTILNLSFNNTNIRIVLRRTETAQAIINAIPFEATIQTWGCEVIFDCPIRVPFEWDATNIVKPGDIGFWPDGSCITIAYGATPISRYGEARLACNCNIWGDALDDVAELANIQPGTRVMVDIWHAENLDQAS